MELLAGMLFTLQGANWQRAGGKGERPQLIKRPREQRKRRARTNTGGMPLANIRGELAKLRAAATVD